MFQSGTKGVRKDAIWKDEYKMLKDNPKVTKIVYHVIMDDGSEVIL